MEGLWNQRTRPCWYLHEKWHSGAPQFRNAPFPSLNLYIMIQNPTYMPAIKYISVLGSRLYESRCLEIQIERRSKGVVTSP